MIKAFAGEDIEQAVFYPEDDATSWSASLTVAHFEVATGTGPAPGA